MSHLQTRHFRGSVIVFPFAKRFRPLQCRFNRFSSVLALFEVFPQFRFNLDRHWHLDRSRWGRFAARPLSFSAVSCFSDHAFVHALTVATLNPSTSLRAWFSVIFMVVSFRWFGFVSCCILRSSESTSGLGRRRLHARKRLSKWRLLGWCCPQSARPAFVRFQ